MKKKDKKWVQKKKKRWNECTKNDKRLKESTK